MIGIIARDMLATFIKYQENKADIDEKEQEAIVAVKSALSSLIAIVDDLKTTKTTNPISSK
jgi:hypothetical protein